MMRPRAAMLLTLAWLIAGCRSPADPQPLTAGLAVRPVWITRGTAPSGSFRRPLVTSVMVIVGDDRRLYGLDIATGRTRWTLPLPYFVPAYGLIGTADSAVALVSTDGFVVFDPRTGSVRHSWSASATRNSGFELITPQLLRDGRIVYVDRDRMLLRLDPRLGRLDTLLQLPGTVERRSYVAALSVWRDTIYAHVASNALRGARWRNTMPYRYAVASARLDSLQPDPSDSAALTRWVRPFKDVLVSATEYEEPSWLGFDRATGVRRWKVGAALASLGPAGQVAIVGDTLIGVGNDRRAYVIHMPTGGLIRTIPISSLGVASAVVACGDKIFVTMTDSPVWRSRDGKTGGVLGGLATDRGFIGDFGVGKGIAVIGDGASGWMALACPPP